MDDDGGVASLVVSLADETPKELLSDSICLHVEYIRISLHPVVFVMVSAWRNLTFDPAEMTFDPAEMSL